MRASIFVLHTCMCVCVFASTLSENFIRYLFDLFFVFCYCTYSATYPLRGLMCCVFRDALLHTIVVMCGYLHYCHLPVSFDQSGPSPLTSLIYKAFLPTELLLTGCFLFFAPFSKLSVVCENPRRSAVSEILKPPCLAPTIIP